MFNQWYHFRLKRSVLLMDAWTQCLAMDGRWIPAAQLVRLYISGLFLWFVLPVKAPGRRRG